MEVSTYKLWTVVEHMSPDNLAFFSSLSGILNLLGSYRSCWESYESYKNPLPRKMHIQISVFNFRQSVELGSWSHRPQVKSSHAMSCLLTHWFWGLIVLTGYDTRKQQTQPCNEFTVVGIVEKLGNQNIGGIQLNC